MLIECRDFLSEPIRLKKEIKLILKIGIPTAMRNAQTETRFKTFRFWFRAPANWRDFASDLSLLMCSKGVDSI
jgi:hypothetical protein